MTLDTVGEIASGMTMLEAALEYAARGWWVFPLVPAGKRPLTEHGFKDATTNAERIREWWGGRPDANLAIATGPSDLVVLDIDPRHGGMETLASLQATHGALETLSVLTGGGGLHFYFRRALAQIKSRAGIFPGIDVRALGGYVVAPPSCHETGVEYTWLDEHETPARLPEWLLQALQPSKPQAAPVAPLASALDPGERGELAKGTLRFILEGAPPGSWHQAMFKAAIDLKQQHYSLDEARERLESGGIVLDDTHDLPLLQDVYANREPRHPPRPRLETEEEPRADESLVVCVADTMAETFSHLADKAKVKGTPTGLAPFDKLLGGGKRTGEVTAWHAEAKTGKNTLWHYLQYMWLEAGKPQAYASRELTPATEVNPNLLSIKFEENAWLAQMTPERQARYGECLKRWPLYYARGYGYFPLDEIKRWVGELRRRGVVWYWFDHLHYMLEDPEDHKAASKLIKEIKTLAKDEDIHVDIIIQPNKLAEGQQLSLNSMKGGSAMGQAIDNLVVLERVRDEKAENVRRVSLREARSKLARLGHFYLLYNPETTLFSVADYTPNPPSSMYEPAGRGRIAYGQDKQLERF